MEQLKGQSGLGSKRDKKSILEELSDTTFRDLVIEGSSEEAALEENRAGSEGLSGCGKGSFINKLFEAAVLVSNREMAK